MRSMCHFRGEAPLPFHVLMSSVLNRPWDRSVKEEPKPANAFIYDSGTMDIIIIAS